jgi:hypothetical protein
MRKWPEPRLEHGSRLRQLSRSIRNLSRLFAPSDLIAFGTNLASEVAARRRLHEAKASETDQHRFQVEGSLASHVRQAFY